MGIDDSTPPWLQAVTRAFATRRVTRRIMNLSRLDAEREPLPGDIMLAQVHDLGSCTTLDDTRGRPRELQPGAQVVVACGHTSDHPPHILGESWHWALTARGGVALATSGNQKIEPAATRLHPLGLLIDPAGRTINTRRYGLEDVVLGERPRPRLTAVVETADARPETNAAATAVSRLTASGRRVAAARLTGRSDVTQLNRLRAAGATTVLDFTDAGHADTRGLPLGALLQILRTLVSNLVITDVDNIVLQLAHGDSHPETATLMAAPQFRRQLDTPTPNPTGNGPQAIHRQSTPLFAAGICRQANRNRSAHCGSLPAGEWQWAGRG